MSRVKQFEQQDRADAKTLGRIAAGFVAEGKRDAARVAARAAMQADSQSGDAWTMLASACLMFPGGERDALAAALRAVELKSRDPIALYNLAHAQFKCFLPADAEATITRAMSIPIPLNPAIPMLGALISRTLSEPARTRMYLRAVADNLHYYRTASEVGQKWADMHLEHAIASAQERDWSDFGEELKKLRLWSTGTQDFLRTLWMRGRLWDQDGARSGFRPQALVFLEWGFGDQIQFARLASMLKERVPSYDYVTIACSKHLMSMMRTVPHIAAVYDRDALDPDQIPDLVDVIPSNDLMPWHTGVIARRPADLHRAEWLYPKEVSAPCGPFVAPYMLRPLDPAARMRDAHGREFRLRRETGKLAITFHWQGDPRVPQDFLRAVPFTEWCDFARRHSDKFTFHSLQSKYAGHSTGYSDWPSDVPLETLDQVAGDDYQRVAECMALSDIFVGQCGGYVHLAGALGLPAIALLGASHDWRWSTGAPLYGPRLRLHFQRELGDWSTAFEDLDRVIFDSVEG